MLLAIFDFSYPLNTSLQVGDTVYYVTTAQAGGASPTFFSEGELSGVVELGKVFAIDFDGDNTQIRVIYDDAQVSPPTIGHFLMFSKDKTVNTSSLIGYYADVKLSNNSGEKIELFSIGADVFESSR